MYFVTTNTVSHNSGYLSPLIICSGVRSHIGAYEKTYLWKDGSQLPREISLCSCVRGYTLVYQNCIL